jgi:hypothetical protein
MRLWRRLLLLLLLSSHWLRDIQRNSNLGRHQPGTRRKSANINGKIHISQGICIA